MRGARVDLEVQLKGHEEGQMGLQELVCDSKAAVAAVAVGLRMKFLRKA